MVSFVVVEFTICAGLMSFADDLLPLALPSLPLTFQLHFHPGFFASSPDFSPRSKATRAAGVNWIRLGTQRGAHCMIF
ncbi:hypothetical protein V6N13_143958 [Hibiscus sabdariffa]